MKADIFDLLDGYEPKKTYLNKDNRHNRGIYENMCREIGTEKKGYKIMKKKKLIIAFAAVIMAIAIPFTVNAATDGAIFRTFKVWTTNDDGEKVSMNCTIETQEDGKIESPTDVTFDDSDETVKIYFNED